jgi:hypothetical protein
LRSRGRIFLGRCNALYAHNTLVPAIKNKRCHNGRTFGLMFIAMTRLAGLLGDWSFS